MAKKDFSRHSFPEVSGARHKVHSFNVHSLVVFSTLTLVRPLLLQQLLPLREKLYTQRLSLGIFSPTPPGSYEFTFCLYGFACVGAFGVNRIIEHVAFLRPIIFHSVFKVHPCGPASELRSFLFMAE